MTRDEIRMKLWCDVYARNLRQPEGVVYKKAAYIADICLEQFDERFPAESEPRQCCPGREPGHDGDCSAVPIADEYEGRVGATVLKTILEWCEGNIESGSQVAPFCIQVRDLVEGALTYPGCKRAWNDPADEPRRVWVTFGENGDLHCAYGYEEAAKKMVDVVHHLKAYAEFQQVGPMVRRDDE